MAGRAALSGDYKTVIRDPMSPGSEDESTARADSSSTLYSSSQQVSIHTHNGPHPGAQQSLPSPGGITGLYKETFHPLSLGA